jgi:hypothetical protein
MVEVYSIKALANAHKNSGQPVDWLESSSESVFAVL